MANELARIGFAADTTALSDAKQKLEAIVPAAQKAAGGAERFKAAASGMASAASTAAATGFPKLDAAMRAAAQGSVAFGSAANAAASGASALNRAAMTSTSALGTVQQAAVAATGAVRVAGQAAQQYGPPTSAWEAYRSSLSKVPTAANGAKTSLDRLGASANDNINKLQSTPGNIAAQFQDIGVTAAGGMSPLLIGLQQGTQLSAAFQGGLGNLKAGLLQVFNPTSLLTIAIVALIAVVIQMGIEWFNARNEGDELSKTLDSIKFASDGISDAQGILGKVFDLTTGKMKNQTAAAIDLARAQLLVMKATAQNNISKASKDLDASSALGFTGRLGAYVSGDRALIEGSARVDSLTKALKNNQITGEQTMKGLQTLYDSGSITEKMFLKGTAAAANYGAEIQNVKTATQALSDLESGTLSKQFMNERHHKPKKPPKPKHDPWSDIVERGQNDIATENARMEAMQLTGAAAAELEQKQKLLNAANSAGIKLTDQQRQKIDELAAAYGKAKYAADVSEFMKNARESSVLDLERIRMATQDVGLYGREAEYASKMSDLVLSASKQKIEVTREMLTEFKRIAGEYADAAQGLARDKFMEQMRLDAEQTTFALQREAGAVGLTSVALDQYNYVTERLTAAKRAHIELTPAEIASIEAAGAAYASQRDMIDQNRAALDLAKDSARGFISDLKSGLDEGKGIFKSFTDSVLGMLDKVISKLMDVTLNAAFDGNTKGSMGFISALGSLFSGGGNSSALGASVRSSANASLNAIPHAKGAVITGPAMFAASGGAHQMGEAGPEGILPLKRGSDGSLGVQMHGGRGGPMLAPTVHFNNTYVVSGSSTADMQATVRAAAEQQRDQLRQEVPSIIAEYQMNGAVGSA